MTGKPLSGAALLLKLASGESSFDDDATSGAGAHGRTQFMPGTRQAVLKHTGGKVDPYGSIDDAYHAAAIHLRGELGHKKGLEGYNPGGGAEYVRHILGQRIGNTGAGSGGGGRGGGQGGGDALLEASRGGAPALPDAQSLVPLLAALSEPRGQRPVSAGVAPPAFAASAPFAAGAQVPQSSGGPVPQGPDTNALLELVQTLGAAAPGVPVPEGAAQPSRGAGDGTRGDRAADGRVVVPASANRPGVDVTPGVLRVARMVAAEYGKPLRVGTGTRHSRMTTSGNVSDHWTGNGLDIPAAGEELTKMGRAALVALGMSPEEARKAKGGIYNLRYGKKRRVQVIFNTTQGGNHFNHLHIGVTPPR